MCTILTDPGHAAQRFSPQERMERLAGIDADRMQDALTFLIWFSGAIFDEIIDATEPENGDDDPEPAPFCQACGQPLGIFLKLGLEWRHYKGTGEFGLDHIEVLEADHDPILAWRIAVEAAAS
jgi:hypothetical protein